jgi:hypothetical protein
MDTQDLDRNVSLEELLERARKEEEMEQRGKAPPNEPVELFNHNDEDNNLIEDLLEVSDQKKKKTRKPTEKLTEDKLLAPTGFPELIKLLKGRKFKHSKVFAAYKEQNLREFMKLMQMWGHSVFPKATFKDFIRLAEKLCSRRRMRVLRVYVDVQRGNDQPAAKECV